MTRTRKIITASVAALTLAGAVTTTATPAAAWCNGWTCYSDGPSGGAIAAGVIGGLALGAIAAGAANAAQPAYSTCLVREARYDHRGRFRGYRRVRVAC
ncbi:MAG: hypothetical protein KDJ12_05980 [Hyphomicrobiales bacterium]|nr:hypothetical protein [Hyphomicrobiales bacterium]